jgi:hypothetical protein
MTMPKDKGKQALAPSVNAFAINAKTPGPGVTLKIKMARKKVIELSSDIANLKNKSGDKRIGDQAQKSIAYNGTLFRKFICFETDRRGLDLSISPLKILQYLYI